MDSTRQRPPFGIAQIGKALQRDQYEKLLVPHAGIRTNGDAVSLVKPGTDEEWFEKWRAMRMQWFVGLGMAPDRLRWHKHEKLAHYARAANHVEFQFPFGWGEIEGVHNRGDFD